MTLTRRSVGDDGLSGPFAALRAELDVPLAFPPEVLRTAEAAAARGPSGDRVDARDIPLVTIDPPGSRDLDQAVAVTERADGGLDVRYAIADVAAFVEPGDAVDEEAWLRGVSRYTPDLVTPLHPVALSEGAASLLPGTDRPAVLWSLAVDAAGDLVHTDVRRATVRSREQLTYAQAQARIDAGADRMLTALSTLGRLRAEREWVRGGVSLELPDQEVVVGEDGGFALRYRAPLPVEGWNAQVSLLCGHAAGLLMQEAGIGVLRTLPPPDPQVVQDLRRRGWALGLPWPPEVDYAAFVRTLDPHEPVEAAMITMCAVGLRGAGYVAFGGTSSSAAVPAAHRHEALAMVYAHVTAPLRRLVDRYAAEVCLAVAAGREVPDWVRARLDDLPTAMGRARGRAGALDRAVLDLVEAQVLADRIGDVLAATVVRSDDRGSEVQVRHPAVTGRVADRLPVGHEVQVRVDAVDVAARSVTFAVAPG